ncbi:MAG TPA: hypothetical protein VE781_14095 [Kineosporiaceae bacterium]|nr:hypothetical protein [Kineosporiaceae bacterium]
MPLPIFAEYRALERSTRRQVLRDAWAGRLPEDPAVLDVATRWSQAYPRRAALQLVANVGLPLVVGVLLVDGPLRLLLLAIAAYSVLSIGSALVAALRLRSAVAPPPAVAQTPPNGQHRLAP